MCGPSTELGADGYGGGKGGYVRNVTALLAHFSSGDVNMTSLAVQHAPLHAMVEAPPAVSPASQIWAHIAANIRRGGAVHVMMTYGIAIYREFGMSVIAALFRRPVILDIRGGGFVLWLESADWLQRAHGGLGAQACRGHIGAGSRRSQHI